MLKIKKIKPIVEGVLFFLIFYSLVGLLIASTLICIQNFVEINRSVFHRCSVGLGPVISIVATIYYVIETKRIKRSKFSFWIGKNYPKLLTVYLLLNIALVSIKSYASWSTEEIYDVLSIQWTIFGFSLTVFLVWNVVIEYLKRKQPIATNILDSLHQYEFLMRKESFLQEIEETFSPIILLSINLIMLVLSTTLTYILKIPDEVFVQNIVLCSFYFTINTIFSLFFGMLKLLKDEKRNLLDENTVTKEDLDYARAKVFVDAFIEQAKKTIEENIPEDCSEEEKNKLVMARFKAFIEDTNKKDNSEA